MAIFTTEEQATLHSSLMVTTKKGQLLPLSRDHLFISVYDSCRHRPASVDDATALTQTILSELLKTQNNGIVHRNDIARVAHSVLQRFDDTAATVYSAYHPAL
jgi:transcriptional regulator NrdR family protein